MNIVFMGTPEFAVPILEGLNEKYNVSLVISQPNREKKKGVLLDTPVAKMAKNLNLCLIQPEKIIDSYDEIIKIENPVLISAAYGQYIPSKILNLFKYKINVHGSILPFHRGGAPIQRCLMNGDTKTGVTIMEMAKGLDTGKIYAIKEYEISDDDNASILFDKLSLIGKDLLLESLEDIINDKNLGYPQDDSISTYSRNIEPSEEIIDLNNNAINIINQIRGLAYNPGAYLNVNGIKLKIYKAELVLDQSEAKPGTVLKTKKEIVIKVKDNAIRLLLVQMPGKNMISGKDFANGQKIFEVSKVIE